MSWVDFLPSLQTEMDSRYERLKVIAIDQLGQDCLSPRLMIKLILEIRLEVKDYDTFYNVAFSRLDLWNSNSKKKSIRGVKIGLWFLPMF